MSRVACCLADRSVTKVEAAGAEVLYISPTAVQRCSPSCRFLPLASCLLSIRVNFANCFEMIEMSTEQHAQCPMAPEHIELKPQQQRPRALTYHTTTQFFWFLPHQTPGLPGHQAPASQVRNRKTSGERPEYRIQAGAAGLNMASKTFQDPGPLLEPRTSE